MDLKTLEEMAEATSDLIDETVKMNRQTKQQDTKAITFEMRVSLVWLKGKIEELISERRPTAPLTSIGREL